METNTFRLIFAKHDDCPREFIFSIPPNVEVHKGDVLLVDTSRGPAVATATCEPFVSSNINELATKLGAHLPLKRVIQAAGPAIQKYIARETRNQIRNTVDFLDMTNSGEELPY